MDSQWKVLLAFAALSGGLGLAAYWSSGAQAKRVPPQPTGSGDINIIADRPVNPTVIPPRLPTVNRHPRQPVGVGDIPIE